MKIVCMSDIHNKQRKFKFNIPDGDVFVFTGDMCGWRDDRQMIKDIKSFNEFINTLPHKHKVIIAGNHDFPFQTIDGNTLIYGDGVHYLQDSEVVIDGVKFYGSPWQPWFYNWAFNVQRGEPLAKIWKNIPDDTNILLTHGAPKDILDVTDVGDWTGCADLRERIKALSKLKVHCFGHIHESYGVVDIDGIKYVNASTCDLMYKPVNPPIVVEI